MYSVCIVYTHRDTGGFFLYKREGYVSVNKYNEFFMKGGRKEYGESCLLVSNSFSFLLFFFFADYLIGNSFFFFSFFSLSSYPRMLTFVELTR